MAVRYFFRKSGNLALVVKQARYVWEVGHNRTLRTFSQIQYLIQEVVYFSCVSQTWLTTACC
jgi:hypothetical protein